ncbi:MFS transporter [Spongiactinospora rosea]|uniref:MFS transporter n=1 Tax=Spongiactinospora rosea TaxID=2248750 RepID=A0A366LQ61_9ACTN|nr:Cmx/CmrA family chloramphenicol efflux MFS transporter [Spongiactinospora rosea]RBQ15464.1 MFS transporter [Spongiactinospora rosea]
MPLAIYILGLAIFAQGTSELMLAGLLPGMAADLGVSVPDVGLLISAFAVGMLVGAPVLAVVTLRWPRRTALLAFLGVFVVSHIVGALTTDYTILLISRAVGAFVYAGFWAVSAVAVIGMVPANARGRALGVVTSGLTVATVVGLPAGTLIGQHLGWQGAFWAVAAMSALSAIGVAVTIPGGRPPAAEAPRLGAELRAMVNLRLWFAYGTTALTLAALMVTFSYLAPLLTETAGLPEAWVPAVLGLYGVGAFIGITLGGRATDARPFTVLYTGAAGMIVTTAGLAVFAGQAVPAVILSFFLGAFGFAINPALSARVFTLAGAAPTLAAGANVSSFNIGITIGPWLGGLAIGAGLGYPSITWIGIALGIGALALVAVSAALNRRAERVEVSETPVADTVSA